MVYRVGSSYYLGRFRFIYSIVRSGPGPCGIYHVLEFKPLISSGIVSSGSLRSCRRFLREIDPCGELYS